MRTRPYAGMTRRLAAPGRVNKSQVVWAIGSPVAVPRWAEKPGSSVRVRVSRTAQIEVESRCGELTFPIRGTVTAGLAPSASGCVFRSQRGEVLQVFVE